MEQDEDPEVVSEIDSVDLDWEKAASLLQDPTKNDEIRQEEKLRRQDQMRADRRRKHTDGEQKYTDEMQQESYMKMKQTQEDLSDLNNYLQNYQGNILVEDPINEVLYKMHNHIYHVNFEVDMLLKSEESMAKQVKQHERVGEIFASFEKIPEALEGETTLLETIDHQLEEVARQFEGIVANAIQIQGQQLSSIPNG